MEQNPIEKMIVPQLAKKFSAFYGIDNLIAMFKEPATKP
jgi:hypothetical protein